VPLATIVLAGLVHAAFEDWLFAVGYYLCVFYWPLAFSLMDFAPARESSVAQPSPLWLPAQPNAATLRVLTSIR
jgi:hypothetical protein